MHICKVEYALKCASAGCILDGKIEIDKESIFSALNLVIKLGRAALPTPSETEEKNIAPRSFSADFFFKLSVMAWSFAMVGSTLYQKWVSMFASSKPTTKCGL